MLAWFGLTYISFSFIWERHSPFCSSSLLLTSCNRKIKSMNKYMRKVWAYIRKCTRGGVKKWTNIKWQRQWCIEGLHVDKIKVHDSKSQSNKITLWIIMSSFNLQDNYQNNAYSPYKVLLVLFLNTIFLIHAVINFKLTTAYKCNKKQRPTQSQ